LRLPGSRDLSRLATSAVAYAAIVGAPLAHAQSGSPAAAPDDWALAFLDVETTGLVPGYHEMIDLGLVMTDLDGGVIDSLFIRIQPEHP